MIYMNREKAHKELDHIFKDLLPAQGMPERPEQIALSHRMLNAMLDNGIALCDAGTGIGKTYAYLAAGMVFHHSRFATGLKSKPILISTSNIALQNAVQNEYLPFLSSVLMAGGITTRPIKSVIRKGKSHYVCDERLERRLGQLDLDKKNWNAGTALLSLRDCLDCDEVSHLSTFDRERVCVPKVCDCGKDTCRYQTFLKKCGSNRYQFQICNHNLLLADAIHRSMGRRPVLPEAGAVIVDESHKLPEAARQMFGVTLMAEDIQSLIRKLRSERYLLAAETLETRSAPLLQKMSQPFELDVPFSSCILC